MDIAAQLADAVGRLLQAHVDPDLLRSAEGDTWPAELWAELEDLGIADALVPVEAGGHGLGWQDIAPSFIALGYHTCPLPVGENALARALTARAGLPLPDGISTLAVRQADPLTRRDDGTAAGVLQGVPWAGQTSHVVFDARDARGHHVCRASLAGLAMSPQLLVSRIPHSSVEIVGRPEAARSVEHAVLTNGAMLRALQLVGGLKRTLQECVDYANARVQFGKPIGRFQAVQQLIAGLGNEVAAATAATAAAASILDRRGNADLAVAVAKARASAAAGRAASIVHEVHAAIGVTEAYHLHFVTRRLWQWRDDFGSEFVWHRFIGRAARRTGADGLWRFLVTASGGEDAAAPAQAARRQVA